MLTDKKLNAMVETWRHTPLENRKTIAELCRDVAYAAVAAERERFRAPLTAFAADLRACVPILAGHGMAETAAEFAKGASELDALLGPN